MLFSLVLFACFPEITKIEEERFPENPNHDYDEDGLSDAEDCDDANSDIGRPLTYYADSDGDSFGVESQSILSCPADKPDGYIEAKERLGVVVFDCDDDNPTVNPDAEEVCDFIDNDCDDYVDEDVSEAPLWYLDDDGDGYGDFDKTLIACADENDLGPDRYVSNFADCDDSNASVYPNADEYCNDVDDNCNGLIDEALSIDAQLWYQDSDGDGYGSRNSVQPSCEQPTGFVLDATDCNDTDAMINNDAVETCNGLDDNCNGLVDEGADSTAPVGSSTFYADGDGDGYGDPNSTLLQCNVASGFVSNADDCDDGVASIYLNAPETCNGLDDDCDGSTDESDAIDKSEWFADSDGDGYGTGGTSQFACNQPAGFVSQSGDCDDTDGGVLPTATEVCDGVDNNCDGLVDDADANLDLNTATEYFQDADFDGYGNPLQSTFSCLQTPGFVANSEDCDDGNLLRNPDGYEYCNNIDDNCDGTIDELALDSTDYFVDADGDGHGALVDVTTGFDLNSCPTFDPITNLPVNPTGYAPTDDDCDDGDAAISPSASELCTNSVDENCDGHNTAGATDVTTFLVDADGDTFGSGERDSNGDLAYALDLCVQPYGYVPYLVGDSLDCDDGDFAVKPGAVEKCNGKRDDCPADGDNSVPVDEYDDDGDGFIECTIDFEFLFNADGSVNGWENNQSVYSGVDCDDTNADRYPNAEEICNGIFERCNDPNYSEVVSPSLEDDVDGDGYVECEGFNPNSWLGDSAVIGGGDCNDASNITKPGGAPLTDPSSCLTDADGDGYSDRLWSVCAATQTLSEARIQLIGGITEEAGWSIASAGDLDGDGLDDVLIGAPSADDNGNNTGKTYVVLGSSLSGNSTIDLSNADYAFLGENAQDRSGDMVSSAGDVDGDGLDDILIGVHRHRAGINFYNAGKTYLVLGSSLSGNSTIHLANADYAFLGESSYDESGVSVSSAGDVDGDGLDDILIGAPYAAYDQSAGNSATGKTYLILGSSLGGNSLFDLSNADYEFIGENFADQVGSTVSSAGDVDGDGLDDILIGAPFNSWTNDHYGKTYLVLGSSLGSSKTIDLSSADYLFTGENNNDRLGSSISSAGDVDGDGLDDILIGAPLADDYVNDTGKSYLILGSSLGSNSLFDLSSADYVFIGENYNDQLGSSISSAGDVDGDGLDDILIYAPGVDDSGYQVGKSYLVLGSSLGSSSTIDLSTVENAFLGEEVNSNRISSLSGAGDIDGDGLDDVLIGSRLSDDGGNYAGKTVVFSACEN